jgi:hypothetical protein
VSATRATVFGLDLSADRKLSFLEGATAAPTGRPIDLTFDAGEGAARPDWPSAAELISDQRQPDGTVNFQIEADPRAGYRIWGPTYGASVVSVDGRRLWGDPGDAEWAAWQRLLVAQALPFAAVLQGLEPLHASAVALEGGAVAIAGPSGSGKTSLALDLCRRGARFLTDDVLSLEPGEEPIVHPGTPVVGVERGEAQRLRAAGIGGGETLAGDEREAVERIAPVAEPAPLRAVFLLERRLDGPAEPRFSPVGDAPALLASTFNLVLRDPARLARLLDVCASVAATGAERVLAGPGVDVERLGAAVAERIGGGL